MNNLTVGFCPGGDLNGFGRRIDLFKEDDGIIGGGGTHAGGSELVEFWIFFRLKVTSVVRRTV